MSIKLIEPRPGKSPNYTMRGTYLKVYVDRTTGTVDRATARKAIKKIKSEIEHGYFRTKDELTFAGATIAYLQNGGEDRFVLQLSEYFGDIPIAHLNQVLIDQAAHKLYPDATPATRNRQIYTPVSAVMKHVGIKLELSRPKGSGGQQRTDWLWPEQAEKLFKAANELDLEFEIFLIMLCYTGMRLSEAVWMLCDDIRVSENFAYLSDGSTKNNEPRPIHLPPVVVEALKSHPRGVERLGETLFKFRKGGHLYRLLHEVTGRTQLPWVTFHTFCHTYGTWMRRYGGLDAKGLTATGRWKDERSASRYMHVDVSEESRRSNQLPVVRSK